MSRNSVLPFQDAPFVAAASPDEWWNVIGPNPGWHRDLVVRRCPPAWEPQPTVGTELVERDGLIYAVPMKGD